MIRTSAARGFAVPATRRGPRRADRAPGRGPRALVRGPRRKRRHASEFTLSDDRPRPRDLTEGERLGPYRIRSVAGSGGFGTVYLAEQLEPVRRDVALKVKHFGVEAGEARARFEAESQVLARMEHPGIARVLDSGTTPEGQPYFVMEFVDGVEITRYCEDRGLSLDERLELFRRVCDAVQHAHHRGIVHRDLKPSNVLVSLGRRSRRTPKVIDFGVAKALDRPLTDAGLDADGRAGEIMGTPAYMSPEQAAGRDRRRHAHGRLRARRAACTSSCAARLPSRSAARSALRRSLRAIEEEEPTAARAQRLARGEDRRLTVVPRVPPDLDWVAMRCLDKDAHVATRP